METALQIQQVLREEMRESTVITIAHRLEAVRDADYFIRLDQGRVLAHGPANQDEALGTEEDVNRDEEEDEVFTDAEQ